jgi:fructokinase
MMIGIDFGGTKIEGVVLDERGAEHGRRRIATPRDNYDRSIAAIRDLVSGLAASLDGPASIGVGFPGAISPVTGLVKNANSTWLNGRPLRDDLETALGHPVRIENDANCFAVSEAVDGAGAGAGIVFAVIIGTGAGAGLALNGHAVAGHQAIAGEFGHNPLPWMTADEFPGNPCWCGQRGCLETYISGTGFERDHEKAANVALRSQEVIAAMRAGGAAARVAYERYVSRLGRGLASIVNIIDPDVIVLGGGMSNIDELYEDLPAIIGRYVFSDAFDTPVRRNVHGDSSGVRGAAWLWKQSD